ncbi:SAM-dependent chlorinase/fluorinase [Thermobifida halotolerans]|uniref:SAM-dependent chlorinase/fluorinase n=1 Tax=Thermobifida halotolerans TaxID=483545 RepID=A0AA97LWF8_9ACTN|nr:SAM-dependent chlorinase/fluorinase [Thermobifida halotolerans]UOE19280.1 SAM-dependent chlorinase/fluorinase [Thermobifida halotolerans]
MTNREGHSCLSFLTDYGTRDGFVAACRGQMLRHAPGVPVIDITHEIPPGDVRCGATVLADTAPELPDAVHVCVVDPGVGTERRSVALAAGGHVLVGPDNGLLVWAAEALGGIESAVELTNGSLWRHPVSRTFHGRDVYAPVGARIAAGLPLTAAGRAVDPAGLVRLPEPRREVVAGAVRGEVHAVDRFGNCQLSLFPEDLRAALGGAEPPDRITVLLPTGPRTLAVAPTFGAVPGGEPLLLTDSAGRLALAVNGASAAELLGLRVGVPVELTLTSTKHVKE